MKINNSTKKSLLIIALAMASTTYQTQAAPIEHIGDRYIMHIPEMELTGEESLLDVLMMCPEVISLDGNNIIGGDPFSNLYGIGVLPEYRKKGANALIFADLIEQYRRYGFKWAEAMPQMETNTGVQSQWQYLESEQHRRHRCYKKKI